MTEAYDARISNIKAGEIKSAADRRKAAYADQVENSAWGRFRGYNYAAAAQVRTGKSAKDKAADILKDLQTEGVVAETPPAETPPETPPTEGTPPTT